MILRFILSIILFSFTVYANAQALPVLNGATTSPSGATINPSVAANESSYYGPQRVMNVIGQMINNKALANGVAANDPSIANTPNFVNMYSANALVSGGYAYINSQGTQQTITNVASAVGGSFAGTATTQACLSFGSGAPGGVWGKVGLGLGCFGLGVAAQQYAGSKLQIGINSLSIWALNNISNPFDLSVPGVYPLPSGAIEGTFAQGDYVWSSAFTNDDGSPGSIYGTDFNTVAYIVAIIVNSYGSQNLATSSPYSCNPAQADIYHTTGCASNQIAGAGSLSAGQVVPGIQFTMTDVPAPKACTGILINNSCYAGLSKLAYEIPQNPNNPNALPATTTPEDGTSIINDTPPQDWNKQLNPQYIADLANGLMQGASGLTGYDGIPWDSTAPFTTGDVQTAEQSQPAPYVGDVLAPASDPSGFAVPAPTALPAPGTSTLPVPPADSGTGTASNPTTGTGTGTNTGTGTGTNTGTGTSTNPASGVTVNVNVDFGPNPNTPQPSLEDTPTAGMILDPIVNMMAPFKSFNIQSQQGECPTFTFDFSQMLNVKPTVTALCDVLEPQRSMIQTIMTIIYTFASLVIVLTA